MTKMKATTATIFLMAMVAVMLAMPLVHAQNSVTVCINNITAQMNTTVTIIRGGVQNTTTFVESIDCQFGCDNITAGTNQCYPDPTKPTLFVIVPPIVLFFLAFLMLYAAINIKEARALQFLFFGSAMFMMIGNAWYAQSQAFATLNNAVGNVLTPVYMSLIVIVVVAIFYFILNILFENWKNTKIRKRGYDPSSR